jgi:cell shape-determining protein MreD
MKKLFLPLALIFFQFSFNALGWTSWPLFNGPLALVVMFAFFHSLDMRDTVFMAALCGACMDFFSLDVFGLSALIFVGIALAVSFATRFINRHNGFFVFPVIFIAVLLDSYFTVWAKGFFADASGDWLSALFFTRSFVQAVGTTALAVPLYLFSSRCGLRLSES